jgi:hypothetical protein
LWALSQIVTDRFLSRVSESSPSFNTATPSAQTPAIDRVAGFIGAAFLIAATELGMLLGLGRRHGTIWQPLNASAHLVIGERAEGVIGFQSGVTLVGVAVVLVMSAVVACITALLTSSRRTFHRAMTAFGVVLVGYIVHVNIGARTPGGLAAFLDLGELRALYFAAGIASFLGMRYAFSGDAGAVRNS